MYTRFRHALHSAKPLAYTRQRLPLQQTRVFLSPRQDEFLKSPARFKFTGGWDPKVKTWKDAPAFTESTGPESVLTKIIEAAEKGELETLKSQSQQPGFIGFNSLNYQDKAPLHAAALANQFLILDHILQNGPIDIEQPAYGGHTAMQIAAFLGHDYIGQKLQKAGADINKPDEDGDTPLHHAASQGRRSFVKFLLDNNAKTDIRNKEGKTALDLAKEHDRFEVLDVFDEKEAKGFAGIAGMRTYKEQLREHFIIPFQMKQNPTSFRKPDGKRPNVRPIMANGLLLTGLPGTGKSHMARKLAEEMNMPYEVVSYADVASKYPGDTEKAIQLKFRLASYKKPSVLIFDEFDNFVPNRATIRDDMPYLTQQVNQMLVELENAPEKGVTVIGTTNHKNKLDEAAIRSGRMDVEIEVPPPDQETRVELFKSCLKKVLIDDELPFSQEQIEAFATKTSGFSTAAIKKVCQAAARMAVYAISDLEPRFVEKAIEETPVTFPEYREKEQKSKAEISVAAEQEKVGQDHSWCSIM